MPLFLDILFSEAVIIVTRLFTVYLLCPWWVVIGLCIPSCDTPQFDLATQTIKSRCSRVSFRGKANPHPPFSRSHALQALSDPNALFEPVLRLPAITSLLVCLASCQVHRINVLPSFLLLPFPIQPPAEARLSLRSAYLIWQLMAPIGLAQSCDYVLSMQGLPNRWQIVNGYATIRGKDTKIVLQFPIMFSSICQWVPLVC